MKFRVVICAAAILAGLTSCNKDDLAPPVLPSTRMAVINASADVFNILQNGNRINGEASLYPGGAMGYTAVTAGEQNYQLKRMGSPDVALNMPMTLDTLNNYSFFVTGLSPEEVFLLNDKLVFDVDTVAKVRFVNASPEEINLDLMVRNIIDEEEEEEEEDTTIVTTRIDNVAFKTASAFTNAVTGNIEIKIFRNGTSNALLTDTISLQARQGYTIFAKGRLNQSGDRAFGHGVFIHQQ
ncbi:hypothetical protein DJ568_02210 [Mucilaginibacter hurinus]|uniref:DUF4397 domain-containing protein n=1 Tax=Mucilaginibacter hurinus TaxID=2201324 RepID=A0A367GV74_9SPHI|nr:DUF4397 domain-containing protein [Mucilaginibacter hurinus]RCH56691.1 hypothetical protein DJ568_02210 [Mucilaginibacter hurinus]